MYFVAFCTLDLADYILLVINVSHVPLCPVFPVTWYRSWIDRLHVEIQIFGKNTS